MLNQQCYSIHFYIIAASEDTPQVDASVLCHNTVLSFLLDDTGVKNRPIFHIPKLTRF